MTEYLDRPPAGWFVFEIMRTKARSRDWVALVVDVDPTDLPEDYRAGRRKARSCWVRITGKHRNRDAAWEALEGHDGNAALKCWRRPAPATFP